MTFYETVVKSERLSVLLLHGVIGHFKQRALSWFSSLILLMASATVAGPVGVACLIIAMVRICSLIVNGNFPQYPVASYLRVISLVASSLMWVQMSFVLANLGGDVSFAVGVTIIMIFADILNTIYAAQEL